MADSQSKVFEFASITLSEAAEMVRDGLPTSRIDEIQDRLDLTLEELAGLVAINERTLARRKKQAVLPPDESERVFRIARLTDLAEATLGGKAGAVKWFKESNFALGGLSPLEVATNEPGARLVEQLIGRIEHGLPV